MKFTTNTRVIDLDLIMYMSYTAEEKVLTIKYKDGGGTYNYAWSTEDWKRLREKIDGPYIEKNDGPTIKCACCGEEFLPTTKFDTLCPNCGATESAIEGSPHKPIFQKCECCDKNYVVKGATPFTLCDRCSHWFKSKGL